MQKATGIHMATVLLLILANSPSAPAANQSTDSLQFSEAASINNVGVIAGGRV